ncbi:MAG: hypothetical protein ACOY41_04285 [Pseudomonadota bacterium]
MAAKDDFLLRISSLNSALSEKALSDGLLTDQDHNRKASILRNGLAVVGFAALEDFFKKRMSEVLAEVGRTGCSFSKLPERLRCAVTHEAILALKQQLTYQETIADKMIFMQEETRKIASTAAVPYDLTAIAFGYSSSNVGADEIKDAMAAFNIDRPWESVDRVAFQLGISGVSLRNSYKVSYLRRNRAAHVAAANTPLPELTQFVKDALAIAVSFDFLISNSLLKVRFLDAAFLAGGLIGPSDLQIWVVRKESGIWRFKRLGTTRAKKAGNDFVTLRDHARMDVIANRAALAIFNDKGTLVDWVSPA